MPFVTKDKDPDRIPSNRRTDWGTASGRVRHIEIRNDHALYVIEEAPGKVLVKMQAKSGTSWAHDVWIPWRYYVIKAYQNCRVFGREAGFMFFAKKRLESIDEKWVLKKAMFPNVYKTGGICLGFTGHVWDRTPLRAAWAAVRMLYTKPGNAWMVEDYRIPKEISNAAVVSEECVAHRVASFMDQDLACRWASVPMEEALSIEWSPSPYESLRYVLLGGVDWAYNGIRIHHDADVEKKVKELEGRRT